MQLGGWQFKATFWPTLAFLLVFPLFLKLGFWQLDRADEKKTLHSEFIKRQKLSPTVISNAEVLEADFQGLNWQNIILEGRFSRDKNVLLDNQVNNGNAGYFVYTPFLIPDSQRYILVNRGWVPLGENRKEAPVLAMREEKVSVTGTIKAPPKTGIMLADNGFELLSDSVYRTQRINIPELEDHLGIKLLPYIIRLNADSAGGYLREWQVPGSGEEKHKGYAFQWFAMALAVLLIYLVLNIKRER